MRGWFRLLGLTVIPLFALRLFDAARNLNLKTGFYDSGNAILRTVSLCSLLLIILILFLLSRKAENFMQQRLTNNAVGGIFFLLTGIAVTASSALQFVYVFRQADFRHLFMSKKNLFLLGFETAHFRIEFCCAVAGIGAAVWFCFAAFFFFRDAGQLTKAPYVSCLPVLWYMLRAVSDFSISPINPHNALILTFLAVDLILGIFYLRFARFISLDFLPADARRLTPYALLAFIFTLSFKLSLISMLPHTSTDMSLAVSDGLAAITAFIIADITMKKRGGFSYEAT